MKQLLKRSRFRIGATVISAVTMALLGGCGGGGDEPTPQSASAEAVDTAENIVSAVTQPHIELFRDDEGWQLALTGVGVAEVASISANSVELTPVIRKLIAAGTAKAEVVDNEYFIASSNQPETDGIPTEGELMLTARNGERLSFALRFKDVGKGAAAGVSQPSAGISAKAINWTTIWNTAKKMAVKGAAHGVIKAYLRSKGYWCPSLGPWWLCARSAS